MGCCGLKNNRRIGWTQGRGGVVGRSGNKGQPGVYRILTNTNPALISCQWLSCSQFRECGHQLGSPFNHN